MAHPSQPVSVPPLGARSPDPVAVALGNASLFGVGYLLLGRRRLALTAAAGTVTLLAASAAVAQRWCDVAVLGWWAYVTGHGWRLAGGRARRAARGDAGARRQRLVALAVTVPVLLTAGLLRLDTVRLTQRADDARQRGDCAAVLAAAGHVGDAHRLADPPNAARTEALGAACRRLAAAGDALATGLTGDVEALDDGFATLAAVQAKPGHGALVRTVLNGFLRELPTGHACRTATVTDWLRAHAPRRPPFDRSADTVRRTAPRALLSCGEDLMSDSRWRQAERRFRQLLDQYPDHRLAARAKDGARRAVLGRELAHVRELLGTTGSDGRPTYCDRPARYSGADRYDTGVNRALFYGNDEYTTKLPDRWRAEDVTEAVLVVCAEEEKHGTAVRTCPYESKLSPFIPREVTFHKIAVPVTVYELRTGKLVADRTVQIDGASCPRKLEYTTYGPLDTGPPSDVYVKASKADVRRAFEPVVRR